MTNSLSQKEIAQRLVRLKNLEILHTKAKKRIVSQDREIKFLKLRVSELEEQNKEKDKMIEMFRLQLEEIKIKVFGKKHKRDDDFSSPKKRTNSNRDKSSYKRQVPTEITKTENHTIDNCPECNTVLKRKLVIVYYEEDIILGSNKEAIRHDVEKGYCEKCKKWRSAIELPSARCVIGVKLRKYTCYLSIILRLSHKQIEEHIKDVFQISVSQGEIQKILEKESDKLRPEFERLKNRVNKQFAQHYDETTWKVAKGKNGNFCWIMTGTETREAVFLLGKSRGGDNIGILNPKTDIGITDDYGAYKNQFKYHQLCWAHLFRKFRDFAESGVIQGEQKEVCLKNYEFVSCVYSELTETLKTNFDYKESHTSFLNKLVQLSKPNHSDFKALRTIKETLFKNKEKYLTCLRFPGLVPMDNNKAERGLRHLVIKRKISYGSKTERGAETTTILASVLLSLKWMNPDNFFQKYFSLSY